MKDRLSEFQAAAQGSPMGSSPRPSLAARDSPAATAAAMGGNGDVEMGAATIASPMDTFLLTIEDIRRRLERINKSIGDIEYHHRQVLNAVNVEEATRLGRIIDELVRRDNQEAQHIRRTMRELTGETERLQAQHSITPSDLRIRTTQQKRYGKKFMDTMSRFQAMQTTYQTKYRQQLERQYLIVKPQATRQELDSLTRGGTDPATLLQKQIFSMANRQQAQRHLAEMQERHHDIVAIERSIKELHQMFLDMADLVQQQGELIDKIEDYVANTVEYTEHAAQEMREAVVKQKSIQKKKWILLIVVLILLVIIGIVIWLSVGGGGSSGGPGHVHGNGPPVVPKNQ